MPIRYINRREVAWQLRVGKTRSGKPNYYVVQEENLRPKKKRKPDDPDVPRPAATKGAPLEELIAACVPHLGQESFFELM